METLASKTMLKKELVISRYDPYYMAQIKWGLGK